MQCSARCFSVWNFYCWIFICYLPPFQNCIELVCSLSQGWAIECDRLPSKQTDRLTQGKDRATQALLSYSLAWVEQFIIFYKELKKTCIKFHWEKSAYYYVFFLLGTFFIFRWVMRNKGLGFIAQTHMFARDIKINCIVKIRKIMPCNLSILC